MSRDLVRLDAGQIAAAEAVLSRGDRVELIPGPGGTVKLLRVRRAILPQSSTHAAPRRGGNLPPAEPQGRGASGGTGDLGGTGPGLLRTGLLPTGG